MAEVKTGLKSIATGRSDMHRVDPKLLKIEPGWNQREEGPELDAHIDGLALSIAEVGVREPLRVVWRDGEAWVRSGHCRLRASIRAIEHYKADLKTIPVIAEDRYASEADQVVGQIVDNSGKPFTAFEKAKVFKKLIDLGWLAQDIAKKCGVSAAHVSQVLDLLTLPNDVKAMVNAGQVSATLAIQTFKGNNENSRETVKQLTAAVETAQSSGRTRAKPSDMSSKPKGNIRSIMKEIFSTVHAVSDGEGTVTVRINAEDLEEIQAVLGIGIEVH